MLAIINNCYTSYPLILNLFQFSYLHIHNMFLRILVGFIFYFIIIIFLGGGGVKFLGVVMKGLGLVVLKKGNYLFFI
ncbi:hypothetical protein HanIR_Chr16g0845251 [Helianthus annuus]|nr:hypothetical protein HanIR_Chr16g0845251 [Helianthus annuus]